MLELFSSLKRFFLICIALSVILPAKAITELGKAPSPFGEFDFVRIPLKRVGNLILLEAEVDGQTGFFILDTGAPYLVLNETHFNDGRVVERRIMNDVTGARDTVNVIHVERFQLRDLYFAEMEADLTNLGAVENRRGIKILGLMGLNLFLELEMRIDVRQLSLELHRLNGDGRALRPLPNCATSQIGFDFKVRNNILLVKGEINDRKLDLVFDTGAETAVLSNDLSNKVFDAVTITGSKPLIGSSGQSIPVLYGCIRGFMVGEVEVGNCNTVIADLTAMSDAYGVFIDGIIGYDLLAQGMVAINFKERTLTFCIAS